MGINPTEQLTLPKTRRASDPAVRKGSPAAEAKAADDSKLHGGDKIIACTDPKDPSKITPIPVDAAGKSDTQEFLRRQFLLRGKPMTIRVERDGANLDFTLAPSYTNVLPGVRFQMGRIAAMRGNGPAAHATLIGPAGEEGLQIAKASEKRIRATRSSLWRFARATRPFAMSMSSVPRRT